MSPFSRRFARVLAWTTCCTLLVASCSASESPEEVSELADSVTVVIGEKGGIVKAKGVSVTIPAGALTKDTQISIAKMDNDRVSLPKEVEVATAVYGFGPTGTKFHKPVQVQFDTEKELPTAKVMFTKENDETQFEQLASVSTEKKVTASTKHFSFGFVGIPLGGAPAEDAGLGAGDGDGDGEGGERDASSGLVDAGGDELDASGGSADASPDVLDASTGGDAGDDEEQLVGDVITVTSLTSWGEPGDQTWMVYQDGDGPWQRVTVHPATGVYKFGVTSGRYGLAYVCAGAGSSGNVLYSTIDHSAVSIEQTFHCSDSSFTPRTLSGSVTSALSEGSFLWAHRMGSDSMPFAGPGPVSFAIPNLPGGLVTDVGVVLKSNATGDVTRMLVVRDLLMETDVSNFDIAADTMGIVPTQAEATVLNVPGSTLSVFRVEYTTNQSRVGVNIGGFGNPGGESMFTSFAQLPENLMREDDRYRLYAADGTYGSERKVELFTKDAGDLTVTMPDAYSASFAVDTSSYFAASMTFDEVPNATAYSLQLGYATGLFKVTAELPWFTEVGTSHTLTLPDLSSAPDFQSDYFPPASALGVQALGEAIEQTDTATSTLRTTSQASALLPPPE